MKGLNKITCCLLAALLMPCAGHAENEQYGANFNNADIRQFVEIVGQHLGKTILIDPSVQGTISVRSNDTFSQQEYYQFFLSILDLYGYSVITLDNGFLKVVRSANVKTSPGMIADSSRPGVGDELVTRIVPLENVPARDLAPLLRQMMDAGSVGNVVHYEPSNVLILTGRASTINKLIEVIKRVDVIGTEKQQIIHLEYASAEDLAEILNQLISESHGKSQMPALLSAKIVADKRTNSLIISGPEKARQRITSLLKSLDVEESEEGNTRVYYLKYAKATNLVEVLTGVSEKLKDEKGNSRKPSSTSAMDNVAITADEQTNSLVITADQSVQEKLATVIARLDIRRAQVLVEAIIVEVQDGNGLNLGVQWANKNVGAQQFTNTGLPVFNAAQGVADYKKNGGITSANPAWDMFSAYNGMAAGFFNGDWGVESFLLSSSLAGIIAQRLVRRLCPQCRQFTPVSPQQAQMFKYHQLAVTTIGTPVGCPHCHQSGYQGRMAIHEMMVVTPELRAAIHENVDEQALERLVRQQHNALIKNGLQKVIRGDTSWDEVMRVASATLENEA